MIIGIDMMFLVRLSKLSMKNENCDIITIFESYGIRLGGPGFMNRGLTVKREAVISNKSNRTLDKCLRL